MKHATRASALARKSLRHLSQATHAVLVLSAFAAVLLLGGHHLRSQAAEAEALALAEAEAAAAAEEMQLSAEMQRVRDWVARRYRVSTEALEPAFVEAEQSAREAALDPLLIVAMMAVESSFNPEAKSHAGALGLMQVIPRWHMDKIGAENDHTVLFDPRFNVQVGTLVLVEGLQRYGTLEAALQYYNGARHDPEMRYTKRVMSVKRQLQDVLRKSSGA
ncbi:MAG: transglycosylase SLT domain-containing protein [Pseudazoarcus pumilus]|nr:transglycosylase SLT domain-containing protein [Pseudazoarcus pumilus]